MTPLKERLLRLIEAGGPIGVDTYMALCLFDPQHGYYTTRNPFGAEGDFVTAPEVSQMFGELVAVWMIEAWQSLGSPARAVLAEIGPGRGTLASDMLRTIARLAPAMLEGARIVMVEASPRLAGVQRKALAALRAPVEWVGRVEDLPAGPLLIVGNELFDAIPVRHYVRTPDGWQQRVVTVEDGELLFATGTGSIAPDLLPPDAASAAHGSIAETAPAREALMRTIAQRIASGGGVGLFFDYGHVRSATGDTLQAIRRHRSEDVLASPGEADLTSHVDFEALAKAAMAEGLATALLTQGEFLLKMGLLERAGALGAGADDELRQRIAADVERLAGSDQMGTLFKAMMVASRGLTVPCFGNAS